MQSYSNGQQRERERESERWRYRLTDRDHIFTLNGVMSKHLMHNKKLFVTFAGFHKAFDTVLWTTLFNLIITIIIIIIIIVIIIIALKGAIQDFFFFFTISSLCRELSLTRTLKWPGHNQPIKRKSCAAQRELITCNISCATQFEGAAQLGLGLGLGCLTELKSHLFEILLAEALSDEEGEENGVPRENP